MEREQELEVRLNGEEEGRVQTPTRNPGAMDEYFFGDRKSTRLNPGAMDEYFFGYDDTADVFLCAFVLNVGGRRCEI